MLNKSGVCVVLRVKEQVLNLLSGSGSFVVWDCIILLNLQWCRCGSGAATVYARKECFV